MIDTRLTFQASFLDRSLMDVVLVLVLVLLPAQGPNKERPGPQP